MNQTAQRCKYQKVSTYVGIRFKLFTKTTKIVQVLKRLCLTLKCCLCLTLKFKYTEIKFLSPNCKNILISFQLSPYGHAEALWSCRQSEFEFSGKVIWSYFSQVTFSFYTEEQENIPQDDSSPRRNSNVLLRSVYRWRW